MCYEIWPTDTIWQTKVGVEYPMPNQSDLAGLNNNVLAYLRSLYDYGYDLKGQVTALTTIQDVENFVISTGWPTNEVDNSAPQG